jgi:hypothetical protein
VGSKAGRTKASISRGVEVTSRFGFCVQKRRKFVEFCGFEELQRKELIMTPARPGLEVSARWTYREKLFNLLAGRDPIEVLGQTASTRADVVARHPAEVVCRRAIQGKWTPNEINRPSHGYGMGVWISLQVDPLRGRAGYSGRQAGCLGSLSAPQ